MKDLEELSLFNSPTSYFLEDIKNGFPNLKRLFISCNTPTFVLDDKALNEITESFPKLEVLDMDGLCCDEVTDRAFEIFRNQQSFPHLKVLGISCSNVSLAGLKIISSMWKLTHLNIFETPAAEAINPVCVDQIIKDLKFEDLKFFNFQNKEDLFKIPSIFNELIQEPVVS